MALVVEEDRFRQWKREVVCAGGESGWQVLLCLTLLHT